MTQFERERFNKQEVVVDGNTYINCTFTDCILVFQGGELPRLERCTYTRTGIQMQGAAQDTLDYLSTLSGAGLFANVDAVISGVKKGELPISTRPFACDPRNTGTNYGQLAVASAVIGGIALLLIGFIYFGYIYHPEETILNAVPARPLEAEIPLDLMPVLPENLAEAYDAHNIGQEALLESYGWMDEEREIAHIPIELSFDLLIEQGLPTWSATGG